MRVRGRVRDRVRDGLRDGEATCMGEMETQLDGDVYSTYISPYTSYWYSSTYIYVCICIPA